MSELNAIFWSALCAVFLVSSSLWTGVNKILIFEPETYFVPSRHNDKMQSVPEETCRYVVGFMNTVLMFNCKLLGQRIYNLAENFPITIRKNRFLKRLILLILFYGNGFSDNTITLVICKCILSFSVAFVP